MDDAPAQPQDNAEGSTARTDPTAPQPPSDPEISRAASACGDVTCQFLKNDPASYRPPFAKGITSSSPLQAQLVQSLLKFRREFSLVREPAAIFARYLAVTAPDPPPVHCGAVTRSRKRLSSIRVGAFFVGALSASKQGGAPVHKGLERLFVDDIFLVHFAVNLAGDRIHTLIVVKHPADLTTRRAIIGDSGTADIFDHHEGQLASQAAGL